MIGKVKKSIEELSDVDKVKFRELEIVAMNFMVEGIMDKLFPIIENIDHA